MIPLLIAAKIFVFLYVIDSEKKTRESENREYETLLFEADALLENN